MRRRDKEATRQLIIDTALNKFAEKGFNGASISMIAKAAGINQALIYYYFENKQAILDELLDGFVREANSYLITIAVNGYTYGSDEMNRQMALYNQHIMTNEKILRLLLTESLKDSEETPPIFKLIDFHVEGLMEADVVEQMNAKGFNFDKSDAQRKVTEFFTGIMPTIVYSLFREKWSNHFNLQLGELDGLFRQATEDTHDQHHNDN